ncbi:MAG: hypothetical protein ABW321_23910 [Polyangiales bacterium]
MSNSPIDKADWGDDTADLFRSARHAHDPTTLERARFERILSRIEAGSAAQPLATSGSGNAASVTFGLFSKLSLIVLGMAAAYFAASYIQRESGTPPLNPSPPLAAAETTKAAPPLADAAAHDVKAPSADDKTLHAARATRRDQESTARVAARRPRASAERQRPPRTAAGAPSAAPDHDPAAVDAPASVPPTWSVQAADALPRSAAQRVAAVHEPTQQERSSASSSPPVAAPRTPEPTGAPIAESSELDTLKRMQAALRAADYTAALALCAEHERRWPHGKFELERQGVQAIAACGATSGDALSLAKHFLADHPRASLAMRVSSACRSQLQHQR